MQDEYSFCICNFHVKYGAMFFGCITLIIAIVGVAYPAGAGSGWVIALSVLHLILVLAIVGCLFYGIVKEYANFLLPYIFYQWATFIVCFPAFILGIWIAAQPMAFMGLIKQQTSEPTAIVRGAGIVIIIAALIRLGLSFYIARVVTQCRRYFQRV